MHRFKSLVKRKFFRDIFSIFACNTLDTRGFPEKIGLVPDWCLEFTIYMATLKLKQPFNLINLL